MLFIDTDVLAIHHLFIHDKRREKNEVFLTKIRGRKASTTIHNLLELCGLFAVANQQFKVPTVYMDYLESKDFGVFFPGTPSDWPQHVEHILEIISRGHSYGDALVVSTAEEGGVEVFVTWNIKHFKDSIDAHVLTPIEYLQENP